MDKVSITFSYQKIVSITFSYQKIVSITFSYQKIISERIMMSKKRLQEEMQLLNTTPILVIGVVLYSLVI